MSIAILCVFFASLLPVIFVGYAKITGGFKTGKHNSTPREFLAGLEGKSFRARCAHDNSWENFAPFAAAVILAMNMGVKQQSVDILAVSFIIARIGYGLSYIYDKHILRSLIYFLGLSCTAALFILAALA